MRPFSKYKTSRLESFGESIHERNIQFEWPTDKIFELMPEHETMRLSSITLQANSKNQLVGVQCKLSNGLESRLFKSVMAENDDKLTTHTCDFTEEMQIK